MAQEIGDGVAYLKALKGSCPEPTDRVVTGATITEARAQPQPATGTSTSGSDALRQFKGSEKRRSARYKCAGGAELHEVNCNTVHTWASFTDISMLGCYVEAQATYPVGAELRMKLQANGFKIEAKGKVRVNYPNLGMGIAFVDLSEDNQERLKELVNSITQPRVIAEPSNISTQSSRAALEGLPEITNPRAALQSLLEFFQSRQTLMRDDFLRVLRNSQSVGIKS